MYKSINEHINEAKRSNMKDILKNPALVGEIWSTLDDNEGKSEDVLNDILVNNFEEVDQTIAYQLIDKYMKEKKG